MSELPHSALLKLQQDLNQLSCEFSASAFDLEIKNLHELMQHNSDLQDHLQKDLHQLHALLRRFQSHRRSYQQWLNDQIKIQRAKLLKSSDATFGNAKNWSFKAQLERAQCWKLDQDTKNKLAALIGKHANWKFPILYYKPNSAELSRLLVHGDPFYVVDQDRRSVDVVTKHLTSDMRRKLFYYNIDAMLEFIPDHSQGLIVSWNNFRFQDIKSIQEDIKMLAKKLLPGGCMLFDFNDGETVQGSLAVESALMSFAWKDVIIQELKDNNLTLLNCIHAPDYHVSYMLAQRSGELPTVPVVNKIALVKKNTQEAKRIEQEEIAARLYYENLTVRLKKQIKAHQLRDKTLNQSQQHTDYTKILEKKMDQNLAHLTAMLDQYGKKHRATLHAMINVAMLAYVMGRTRDTQNIYKQTVDLIKHVQPNTELQEAFEQLETLIRNIDQSKQIN